MNFSKTLEPEPKNRCDDDDQSEEERVVRYEDFRKKNSSLYQGVECFKLNKLKHVYAGMLPENPVNGRITLMRFGRWDSKAVPNIEDVVRCALLMDELAVMQPKLQILGVTIIVDLEGLSWGRHVRHLTPTVASQIVSLMGINFPIFMHGIHMINYSWILNTFFYVFKQFIPAAAMDRIHFHGYDMSSLHKHISPEFLPPEYGGTCRNIVAIEEWIDKINKYKDDFVVSELRDLGFVINEEDDKVDKRIPTLSRELLLGR
ncbi:unnamed protein product [Plutella xylostella]|uniref:(diamondback moth) hypothetical protein n=1 Tax=Plutella xylostella TaxID=51655 RepID=A0A8S4FRD7_PLUXY|nr:unnamed protein product [Plutella xylostella]